MHFTKWIREINLEDFGNIPSGVRGDRAYVYGLISSDAVEMTVAINIKLHLKNHPYGSKLAPNYVPACLIFFFPLSGVRK